jgi:hypothetical protein
MGLRLFVTRATSVLVSRLVCRMPLTGGKSTRFRFTQSGRRITLLARGASNEKWHSGCLAPDRCVESIL